jgi:hypothetical protein
MQAAARAARFLAAFSSRSMTRGEESQSKTRTCSGSLAFTAPQSEHVFEEGYQRLATTVRQP